MKSRADFIAAEELAFQARVTASVSHEINNVLATISETAGLLADLMELSSRSRGLDTAELRSCADTIVDEVKRGFRVVKNLNVFAHSADQSVAEVNLVDLVDLVAGLAGYLSYASQVELRGSGDSGPRLTTRPLLLEALVYRVFVRAFREVGSDGSIAVSTESTRGGGRIVFSGVASPGEEVELTDIAEALHGRFEFDASRNELCIVLPRSIANDAADEISEGSSG
jgi:signal transduction histidine kinase